MEGTEDERGGGGGDGGGEGGPRWAPAGGGGGDADGSPHPIVRSGNGGVRTPPHSNSCGNTHTVENAKNGLNCGNT